MKGQFNLTEEQEELRRTVRRMAQEKIAPRVAEMEEKHHFPDELFRFLGENGLIGLPFPEEYGGGGGDEVSFCIVLEELARVSADASMWVAQSHLGAQPIVVAGSEEQKRRFLPPITSGETLCSFGLTEPNAGSDVASARTKAVKDGDHYILNGNKCFTSFCNVAGYVSVFAKTDPSAGTKGLSCFVVDTKTPGFHIGKLERKMGFKACPTPEIAFEDCRIPKENLLGNEGDGWAIAMKVLDITRPSVGAMALGIAQGALDTALDYAKTRVQFGQPIANFQAIQFMLADMAMQLEAARWLVYKAASVVDEDSRDMTRIGAMAKCYASDVAMKITVDAVQVLGGYGYMEEYPAEKYMREAKMTQIVEGTNQIQRIVIAREMLRGMRG